MTEVEIQVDIHVHSDSEEDSLFNKVRPSLCHAFHLF